MPLDHIPPPWRESIIGVLVAAGWGLVGRAMHHSRQVQAGRRRFWSVQLVWELPVAVGTGVAGQGLAEYLQVGGWQATAVIVTVAYLGPGFVEAVVWKVLDRVLPARGGDADA